ncbi:hypothetical protein P8452_01149 [Trifolium repens]|nr:hypothetical protein P8452_01149 [Trifolium repens]
MFSRALSLSLLILLLFNSTIIIIAGRSTLPPPPPDPFITHPPKSSLPTIPIRNKTDINPPHHTSSPKNNNHSSSPPWITIGLGVVIGLGALAFASLLIGMCYYCLFSPTANESAQVVTGVPAPLMPLHQWATLVGNNDRDAPFIPLHQWVEMQNRRNNIS